MTKHCWCINYGVNRSHAHENIPSEHGSFLFYKKREALEIYNDINFEEYIKNGFYYFRLVKLCFSGKKISTVNKIEILRENVF